MNVILETARPLPQQRAARRLPVAETPYLVLDVPAAVTRFRRLGAALPGHRGPLRGQGQPGPRAAGRARRRRLPVRRGQPRRGGRRAGGRRRPLGPGLLQPDQAPRRHRVRRPAGRAAVRRGLDRGDARRWPPPLPGRRCSAGSSPPARGRTGRCHASTAAPPTRPSHILRSAAAVGLDPAGISFHVGSQQRDTAAWDAPDRRVGPGLRGAARRRARAVAAGPGRRLPRPPRGRLPAAGVVRRRHRARAAPPLRRSAAADHRRARPRGGRRRRHAGLDRDRRRTTRRHPLGLPRRRGLHRAGRDARRVDPLPHGHQRRRRPDRAVRAGGADVRQRGRALRAGAGRAAAALGEDDTVRLHSTGAYTTCYSTVGFNGFAPLPTRHVWVAR